MLEIFAPRSITFSDWFDTYQRKALFEGWCLYDDSGTARIQRDEDYDEGEELFDSDHSAVLYCLEMANKGSVMHLLACYLDGQIIYQNKTDEISYPFNKE